jgi:hypothetical protein
VWYTINHDRLNMSVCGDLSHHGTKGEFQGVSMDSLKHRYRLACHTTLRAFHGWPPAARVASSCLNIPLDPPCSTPLRDTATVRWPNAKIVSFSANFFLDYPTPKLLVRAYFIMENDFLSKKSTNGELVAQFMSELSVTTKK